MKQPLAGIILCILFGSSVNCWGGAPDWLTRAAEVQTPASAEGAPAVILFEETVVRLEDDGDISTNHRYAVRLLNGAGKKEAIGQVAFIAKSDRVSSSDAWIVRAGKTLRPSEKIIWSDEALDSDKAVFTERRLRSADYSNFAIEGDVFGYETTVRSKLLLLQLNYLWQSRLPKVIEIYAIDHPAGWSISVSSRGPVKPVVQAGIGKHPYAWAMENLEYRPQEPFAAPESKGAAAVMITLSPPKASDAAQLPNLRTWRDVSDWLTTLQKDTCDSTPDMVAAVHQMTEGKKSTLEKISTLAAYVQKLRYVAYESELARGFGYRPALASDVFTKGWGDCKGKANLLRALLREAGIEAFLASADTEFGRTIDESWPSPVQFDHAIIGIKVDDSVQLDAVVDVPGAGRLLFFDPTQPCVVLGDLPFYLQGGKVHVIFPGNDRLTELPLLPPDRFHTLQRDARVVLTADGSIQGEVQARSCGSVGAAERNRHRHMAPTDYNKAIESSLNARVPGAKLGSVNVADNLSTGEFVEKIQFAAPRFAQLLPGNMMVVQLDLLPRDNLPNLSSVKRHQPIAMRSFVLLDHVSVNTPAGFLVEELPPSVEIKSLYGNYARKCEMVDGRLVLTRSLTLADRLVPVGEYAALKKFFSDVIAADRIAAILRKEM